MRYKEDYIFNSEEVAKDWERWCGITSWSKGMRALKGKGVKVVWYGGLPRSASAIPLCFTIIMPNSKEIDGSRLKDIKRAIREVKNEDR